MFLLFSFDSLLSRGSRMFSLAL